MVFELRRKPGNLKGEREKGRQVIPFRNESQLRNVRLGQGEGALNWRNNRWARGSWIWQEVWEGRKGPGDKKFHK